MPDVSVVIPSYNAMKYLPETLESVLQQTYTNYEVIVVNDGSTDDIEAWFESSVVDPRVRLFSQDNKGLSGARNSGIAQAKGEFIAFLDADDLWHPSKLEKQVQSFKKHPEIGLVYTWLLYVDESANPTGKVVRHSCQGNVWKQLTAFNFVGCGSVAMVRKSCFETSGNFDINLDSYVEDWDMWLRIARDFNFAVVREPLVYNRKYSGSLSTHWKKMESSFPKVIEKAFTSTPNELTYLKNRSYAHANLVLAWKVIQSKNKDFDAAFVFWKKSLSYYPQILFFNSFVNLSLILALLSFFGLEHYDSIHAFLQSMRRRLSSKSPSLAK